MDVLLAPAGPEVEALADQRQPRMGAGAGAQRQPMLFVQVGILAVQAHVQHDDDVGRGDLTADHGGDLGGGLVNGPGDVGSAAQLGAGLAQHELDHRSGGPDRPHRMARLHLHVEARAGEDAVAEEP